LPVGSDTVVTHRRPGSMHLNDATTLPAHQLHDHRRDIVQPVLADESLAAVLMRTTRVTTVPFRGARDRKHTGRASALRERRTTDRAHVPNVRTRSERVLRMRRVGRAAEPAV
jgi:hypothetical protein